MVHSFNPPFSHSDVATYRPDRTGLGAEQTQVHGPNNVCSTRLHARSAGNSGELTETVICARTPGIFK